MLAIIQFNPQMQIAKNNNVLVLGGLQDGEEIASAGLQHLTEGMKVKRFIVAENNK